MSKRAIKQVAKLMEETGLMEVSSEFSTLWGLVKRKIHLSKQSICIQGATAGADFSTPDIATPMGTSPAQSDVGAITSPMVGVVYLSPEPDAKPFVTVGKEVNAGDTLCLVEAMKTFNPIKAHKAGVVSDILVKEGEVVEFGTPLVVVR